MNTIWHDVVSQSTPAAAGVSHGNGNHLGEPIAVIGMACRFPGANDVQAFWRLLAEGEHAINEGQPGSGIGRLGQLFRGATVQSEACRFAAFIDDVDRFDAEFFRISPVEAQYLDPQQRIMLETSWQALENAGIDPDGLRGSRTGVYGGISNNEYRGIILESSDTADPAPSLYTVSGTSYNTAIGRVAFAMGLQGPAIALDTACSSSLVAVHQAVTGLQLGEANLALAGGVHTILSGRLLELRANAGMLAPDGRCKTFDASANGYVRGEGCGILVLKRLSEAEADGDRIWGIIRGTAINQDGASTGLTVPNQEAQEMVIQDALHRAGVSPSQVDYVEAHGTGTPVGDPIELEAMGAVYGRGRDPERPLLIGSVKTNFGHLESAAGVAGMMKVLLAMNQGVIPKHLNFRTPTPAVDWKRLPLSVTSETTDWPLVSHRAPLAGVSGFGWSGTNAHVVVEGYRPVETGSIRNELSRQRPPAGPRQRIDVSPVETDGSPDGETPRPRTMRLLPLSGKTDAAVGELASRYLAWLDARSAELASADSHNDSLLSDMAWTAGAGRSHFPCRVGITFRDSESLRGGLQRVAEGSVEALARPGSRVAFVYTGQGSQWPGMGQTLYETEPVVRSVLNRCETVIQEERGVSLLDVMFGREGAAGDLNDTAWAQPAVYSLECALTVLWRSVGVEPSVVIGHSLGEFGAAYAAGAFGLEEGLRFVAKRGALLASVPELGAMAAVFAPRDEVTAAVRAYNAESENAVLCIAVDNGIHQVISGSTADVQALSERFEAKEVQVRPLRTNQAFHSPLVEPVLEQLERAYADVSIAPTTVALVSNVTGSRVGIGETLDGQYWRHHAREAVQFRSGMDALAQMGVDLVIEVGPNAVLGPLVSLAWPGVSDGNEAPPVLESLLRPLSGIVSPDFPDGFLDAVAGAYQAGLEISWTGLFAGEERSKIELPSYPFQRRRHWVDAPRRSRASSDHPLLGTRHESPRGEVFFETEMDASDPAWLSDHRVFGRVIMPGALYGAMAAAASLAEGAQAAAVEDFQLHSPMLFAADDSENGSSPSPRRVQAVISQSESSGPRSVEIFSKGESEEGWTLHAECKTSPGVRMGNAGRIDLDGLKSRLAAADPSAFYRARATNNVDLGAAFRTLTALCVGNAEAVGEVALPESVEASAIELHPILLDGCFQVLSAARQSDGSQDGTTYLPFGWERLWFTERPPARLICHAQFREGVRDTSEDNASAAVPETLSGDLRFYTPDGVEIGGLNGYTVKRATRASLLSATEGLQDLMYEVVWRDRPLAQGMPSADFLTGPSAVLPASPTFAQYLLSEGVEGDDRTALLEDLERLSWSYALVALESLGWQRTAGEYVEPEDVRQRLNVLDEHKRLFRRMLEMQARGGVLEEQGEGFVVRVGRDDPMPDAMVSDTEEFATRMSDWYPHGSTEIGLFRRCAGALADVLTGNADPLTLLFSSGEPTAADLYMKAPVARSANRMLGDTIAALLTELPGGRDLRILEVGAGTGSATAAVLPELPAGRFHYVYTDISAGFFSEAESRFGGGESSIEYRVLDIEKSPIEQGFDAHGYDLVIASNVLHATRYLHETLAHCRELLAPSGQLLALENLRGQGWLDLTFGQLDGWWRFADDYRPHHALAGPAIWNRALTDVGFEEVAVIGVDGSSPDNQPDRGVIMARGPAEVTEPAGVWVLAGDSSGVALQLAAELAARNQTVVVGGPHVPSGGIFAKSGDAIIDTTVDMQERESWRALLENLPEGVPLSGIVHLAALDGHGEDATTAELADDIRHAGASALAMVQAASDIDAMPAKGIWFITRGGQVLEHEDFGQLSGAMLWGFGKVVSHEAPHLQPRMIDLDPNTAVPLADLVNELMYPDAETHLAYRLGLRQAARLVRAGAATERLSIPEDSRWFLEPDDGGALEGLQVLDTPERPLESREVRVAVEAAGLNFWDVFRAIGIIDEGLLGGEVCGRVVEVGSEVSSVSVGDRVVALAFGTFGSEAVMREEMVALAPPNIPGSALATMPTVFVSAALSYDFAGLKPDERVLIHAGAGGVGLAAIQMAQAAGAEIFATASAPKQAYLRSLGVKHVFNSRTTRFGQEILEATGGQGVDVVLNSLTGEGFIEASLSCLARGGRFVELAREGIYSEEEMAAARPDVAYHILKLDVLKEHYPAEPGDALRRVMAALAAGELAPLIHSRWPMSEAGPAMKFMRAARHIGKIVLTTSPLETGRLREDGTYLVTGGLGGIGCTLAGWLAERGAGAIVLNGRRDPDPEAAAAIEALRDQGATIVVELADVTDQDAVDAMLERMDATLPPLAGIIHSVGVLSDAALTNQSWQSFESVLWPKMLGAWHLHRATLDRDLDMFVPFSSVAGVMGNAGQANHAAANAFLDQLAGHRRSVGLAGQSVAWGAWSGLGEAEEQRERIARQLEAGGTGWITPQQGLRALESLVRQDAATGMVAAVDWPTFSANRDDIPPFLEELIATPATNTDKAADESDDLLAQLRTPQRNDVQSMLVTLLQRELQAVMRLPTLPASSVGFFDLGMDSLMAVELRNRLNRAFAGEYVVSNTAVFDYPDITALARHLAEELGQLGGGLETPTAESAVAERPQTVVNDDGIAIVGMACRFPRAKNLVEYWKLLESGTDAVTDGRQEGGPWDGAVGDPAAEELINRRGAFVDDIEWFDSRFFRISPIEARLMDPRQRMMLETSWEALEDAGIDPAGLRGSYTGVYAGVGGSEYRDLIEASGRSDSYLGTTASVTAGRVAFALGLEGPAMPIDMACASSLAAVHQAASALRKGEVNLALAGGVHVVLSSSVSGFMMEAGMLSPTGQCRPFDAAADGYVRGEGCGIVVLKRLSDALEDGDRIWGVIRGTAVNQNGASAALTVPNGPAQERVMETALNQADLVGADVDYLEVHAVGSKLADAIELRAVGAVYGKGRAADRPLLTGTVKANIGHLEAAAGIAGLIKTALAMKQGVIPRQLNFENPNPEIGWQQLPVEVPRESVGWPACPDRAPRAAVSAFGISGANAHVVLEGYQGDVEDANATADIESFAGAAMQVPISLPESVAVAPPADSTSVARRVRLLPLSGKTDGALRDLAKQYLSWIDSRAFQSSRDADESRLLADMARSAGLGRSHFAHRAGVVFTDADSLRRGLLAVAGTEHAADAPEPQPAAGVVFRYRGEGSQWAGMGAALYESEPVARAILNLCEEVALEDRGASLLDVMFGRAEMDDDLNDPSWARPAIYALECALTALWSSLGIRPNSVLGDGCGARAAAQAIGAFSLEAGLRLAMDNAPLPPEQNHLEDPARTIDDAGADMVIEIGPGTVEDDAGFLNAVAKAYEAGSTVSFEGLFAGESRRRIALPSYQFQRRRHWI